MAQVKDLLHDKSVRMLVVSVALFHIANAPVMPLVGFPVALLAGKFCTTRGRKPIFAIAFLALSLRIFLYTLTTNPNYVLAIQALDGVGAGTYGVVIALMCSDLTKSCSSLPPAPLCPVVSPKTNASLES